MNLLSWTGESEKVEYDAQKKVIDTIYTIYAEENMTAENSLTLIQVKQKRGSTSHLMLI